MLTDEDYLKKIMPCLDLSLLKFKERDFMESIMKFWAAPNEKNTIFPVKRGL